MEERAESSVGFSHMATLAALSVIALLGISAWQIYHVFTAGNPVSATNAGNNPNMELAKTPYAGVDWQAPVNSKLLTSDVPSEPASNKTNDPDGISNIEGNVARAVLNSYVMLNEAGIYTPQDGQKIADDIATSLRAKVSFKTYSETDLTTDMDTSYERMLKYRNDLRIALEPLLGNPGYELGLFANYIESRDQKYTKSLKTAAKNYRDAVEKASAVVVPIDAAQKHVAILNALSEFGTIVDRMADHADDAFASAALLGSYNSAEQAMVTSFNALALYQKGKKI